MAARRTLWKLRGGASNLLGDAAARSHSSSDQWSQLPKFAAAADHYQFSSSRDGDESPRHKQGLGAFSPGFRSSGIAMAGNSRIFGMISAAAITGSGGLGPVRFCSSMSESPAAEAIGFPERLVDAAQEMVSSGGGATYDLSKEIAAAMSESFPWTAAVQYLIYGFHNLTGLPWWISIALTTVMIRTMVLPMVFYQVRSTAKFTLLRPELEQIKAEMQQSNYDPAAVAENKRKMAELFARYKTDPFTPLLGALLQGPIFMCFFFGLRTMAEKMDSFKEGGAYWFTDLTTPDELYILPFLTTATFLITVELNSVEGMHGQPHQKMMKNILRGMGVAFLPLTAAFPKALFCYWITSNFWSMLQGTLLRNKKVKEFLNIPETSQLESSSPAPPVITSSKSPAKKTTHAAPSRKARRLAQ